MFKAVLISLIVLLMALAWILGPRTDLTWRHVDIILPDDLDAYLEQQESTFTSMRDALRKTIIWAHDTPNITPYSIVYLHGFSASHKELYPLPQQLAASLSANLYLARLKGHGLDGEAMAQASLGAWLHDTSEAFAIGRRIGERVIIMANSTGATLASIYAAYTQPEDVQALILLAPNFAAKDPRARMLTWPWAYYFVPWIVGTQYHFVPQNEAHERYWTNTFPSTALLPVGAAVKIAHQAPLESINIPTLVFYHPQDRVVDSQSIEAAFTRFGGIPKGLLAVSDTQDRSYHVLAGDALSPAGTANIKAQIEVFLHTLSGSANPTLDQAIPATFP